MGAKAAISEWNAVEVYGNRARPPSIAVALYGNPEADRCGEEAEAGVVRWVGPMNNMTIFDCKVGRCWNITASVPVERSENMSVMANARVSVDVPCIWIVDVKTSFQDVEGLPGPVLDDGVGCR